MNSVQDALVQTAINVSFVWTSLRMVDHAGIKKQCCIKRKCIRTAKAEADVANVISRLYTILVVRGGTI